MVMCECSEIGGLYGTGLNFMGGVRSDDLQVGRIFFLQTVTFHVNSPLRLDSGAVQAPFFCLVETTAITRHPVPVIPAKAGIQVAITASHLTKSRQWGFMVSITLIFHVRFQFLIAFSQLIADAMVLCTSYQTR